MGPKGYRICWLGRNKDRMLEVLEEDGANLGQCYFLPYPGTGREELENIHPSMFVVDAQGLESYRYDLLRWISACRETSPQGKIMLLSQSGYTRFSPELLRKGTDWVVPATEELGEVKFFVRSMVFQHKAEREVVFKCAQLRQGHFFERMLGNSPVMKALFRLIEKCAPSGANVLIRGESGTGKELVARAIHRLSGRSGNLVTVNCAALMDNLHQSELFGHEKGAFTDAKARRIGYFEAARGGTLFLDEIGDISPATQVGLLRVIESKEFIRVGGCDAIHVDVRVVSATHRNLEERVRAGKFREDLYYRLNGFGLTVPPLRERKEDVPLLAEHFLHKYAQRDQKEVKGFTPEAMDLLCCHHWPGNVRELENEMQRLVIQAEAERHVASEMLGHRLNKLERLMCYRSASQDGLKTRLQQVEAHIIREELKTHNGNRTRAAASLGISREGLHKKMARYKIR